MWGGGRVAGGCAGEGARVFVCCSGLAEFGERTFSGGRGRGHVCMNDSVGEQGLGTSECCSDRTSSACKEASDVRSVGTEANALRCTHAMGCQVAPARDCHLKSWQHRIPGQLQLTPIPPSLPLLMVFSRTAILSLDEAVQAQAESLSMLEVH